MSDAAAKPLEERLEERLKDALYVGVGLGVLAFQKAQVQRRQLQQAVEERLRGATGRS